MNDARRFSEATTRNREPIFDVLARVLKPNSRVLEIAAGSGEHAVFLAEKLAQTGLVDFWQPSDADAEAHASIDAWRAHANAPHVRPAIDLDVTVAPWPKIEVDVITCMNMIHISPWQSCEALFRNAPQVLAKRGMIFLYGPYKRNGEHTAPTNEIFDRNLRARNPEWGVRDLEAVETEAQKNGFLLLEVTPMPSNNFSLVFDRS